MTKRTVKSFMVIVMLLVVALYFVSGTYARYIDEFTGSADATVAKWAVKVGDAAVENKFTITLTEEENENVVNGKIAPDVTLNSNDVVIDLTGTEVAVDVKAEIDPSELESALSALGESADDVTASATVYKGESGTASGVVEDGKIPLPDQTTGFTAENGKFHIVVQVKWTNNESHNESDTTAGKTPVTLKIPVKVTLKQHLAKDDTP